MLTVDDSELKQLTKNLKSVDKYAFPDAVRSTLNNLAYKAKGEYEKNVRAKLTIRNKGYLKTIGFENCDRAIKDVDKMESKVGQRSQFFGKEIESFRKQELGETIRARGKHIVKPTRIARGGSYKRLVKEENLLSKLKVKRISDLVKHPASGAQNEFKQAIAYTKRHGEKINFLPSRPSNFGIKGVYEIDPNRKKAAELLYSFKGKTQNLKPVPMLEPASNKAGAQSAEVFKHEAQRRIARELSKGLQSS